jgi:hypothetical protein
LWAKGAKSVLAVALLTGIAWYVQLEFAHVFLLASGSSDIFSTEPEHISFTWPEDAPVPKIAEIGDVYAKLWGVMLLLHPILYVSDKQVLLGGILLAMAEVALVGLLYYFTRGNSTRAKVLREVVLIMGCTLGFFYFLSAAVIADYVASLEVVQYDMAPTYDYVLHNRSYLGEFLCMPVIRSLEGGAGFGCLIGYSLVFGLGGYAVFRLGIWLLGGRNGLASCAKEAGEPSTTEG